MEKILIVDLTTKEVISSDYNLKEFGQYGRGLALNLIDNIVPIDAGRYSPENAIIFIPGLFTGCKVASSCRLMIATKKDKNMGMQLSNTTGNFPQKMASLSIAGLVIKGSAKQKNTILHISKGGIEILTIPELENKRTSVMMKILKDKFGDDAGIIAVGKAADMQMSLSSFICTYPNGEPEYNCPRSGFGDVVGSKGLRAVVVTGNKYFDRGCFDEINFQATGKELAKLIIDNDICGGALPAFGSLTLIKILEDKEKLLSNIKEKKAMTIKNKDINQPNRGNGKKINFCCAPMCVIGCLNRHSVSDGEVYSSPDESEVREALKSCYGIDDYEYTKELRNRACELGIVGTEFVTATKVYFEATGLPSGEDEILQLLDEIENGTVIGRLVASRTFGISKLYSDNKNLFSLLDREAIQDESDYEVSINKFSDELEDISEIDLLYAQIFVLENLGFCIFSSFATVNNEKALDLMAKLFTFKTGIDVTPVQLINYAINCMKTELEYERRNSQENIQKSVPPFTKVLYRYFGK
jgi:aldehyde:ferredoxin oxidoreductase